MSHRILVVDDHPLLHGLKALLRVPSPGTR